MFAKTFSFGLIGIDAYPITIEVHCQKGLPGIAIVGLPDSAVRESRERVHSAIKNSGFDLKPQKITINLSPADTKKEGASFDLAIALGILAASEAIDAGPLKKYVFLGELSLDGAVQPARGVLPIVFSLNRDEFSGVIVPSANAQEAAVCQTIPVYPMKHLNEIVSFLSQPETSRPYRIDPASFLEQASRHAIDFADVKGQFMVKRGLEVAAAGGHNVVMIGPPGSGKTMLARRLPTILPDLTLEESLETTKIHSIAGLLPHQYGLIARRPFRSPHHTCSDIALIGGGSIPKPGEVTLAHNGILFLDELPEFSRRSLEALRQPLEDRFVTVSRASKTSRFPSSFMLVASMNPCPCGFATSPHKECHCSPLQIQKYMSKISGPLLDRIDIHLDVPALNATDLISAPPGEASCTIKERTVQARGFQQKRFFGRTIFSNAQMSQKDIRTFCQLSPEGNALLHQAIEELKLSARAHDKILKVARSIADLADVGQIQPEHIAEAIQYRCLDRT